jgi:UDP-glucose 4-epimerase
MRIFVTGGAGYVGGACMRRLLAAGHEAYAYDNLAQGHPGSIPASALIRGDLADTGALGDALRRTGAEAVIHFAAATSVGESATDPEYYYRNNVAGSLSLLSAMRAAGVRRLLFSSTCATYGMAARVPMGEETPQEPFSPYARTKLAVEWMIRDFAHAYSLGFTLLRYFNAAGAAPDGQDGEDHEPETHLIPLVLRVAAGRSPSVTIFGDDYPTPDGTCIRDYVHVDDLAEAHLLAVAATTPETAEVYNVGTGRGTSVLEVIRACEEATGRPIGREVAPRRSGDPPALVADPSKLMGRLGWRPKYPGIGPIVETAWRWHSTHPDGYDDRVARQGPA